jgi:serine/threonine-protein kinase HipA
MGRHAAVRCGGKDGHDSTIANALSQHMLFGLSEAQAKSEIDSVILCVKGWKEHFQKCGVSAADIET